MWGGECWGQENPRCVPPGSCVVFGPGLGLLPSVAAALVSMSDFCKILPLEEETTSVKKSGLLSCFRVPKMLPHV